MTCAHVLGLIDAAPFAGYPRAHLDAAWRHARQCATCGPALDAATALTADLIALPQPAPPADLAAAVLARIARIEQEHSVPAAAARQETTATAHSGAPDWSPWITALGGLAAGLAIVLLSGNGLPINIAFRRGGSMTASLIAMPPTTTGALILAVGLVLYVAGVFVPISPRVRKRPAPRQVSRA